MKPTRKVRILTAFVALCGMLFMQLAVAAYACPGLTGAGTTEAVAAHQLSVRSMPGCDQPDPAKPALCHAHCLDGKSSLDKPDAPVVAPAAIVVSAILTPLEPLAPALLPGTQPASFLQRITAPPISIQNCCFRI